MRGDYLGDDPSMEDQGTTDFNVYIGELMEEVTNWADSKFPHRTDASMYLKMYSEIGEMIESDGDSAEIADVFIMLLDYASRKQVDIAGAVRAKLVVNRTRQWAVDKNGVYSHVK